MARPLCQILLGNRVCGEEATLELDLSTNDEYGVFHIIGFVRVHVCAAHGGLEAEIREVEPAVTLQPNACPTCGRTGVAPTGEMITKHTTPNTYDLCPASETTP